MSLDAAPDRRFRHFLSARFSAQMAAQMQVTAVAWLGPVTAVVAGGTIAFGAAASWAVLFPGLRRLDRL